MAARSGTSGDVGDVVREAGLFWGKRDLGLRPPPQPIDNVLRDQVVLVIEVMASRRLDQLDPLIPEIDAFGIRFFNAMIALHEPCRNLLDLRLHWRRGLAGLRAKPTGYTNFPIGAGLQS